MQLPQEPAVWTEASQGRLADTSVAQLLAVAYLQQCSGSLILEVEAGQLSAIRFVDGWVQQVRCVGSERAHERGALGMFLPPDSLAFARKHAKQYQVDLFAAATQLALLPEETLRAAQEAYITRGIEKLSQVSASGRYRFRPGEERLKGCPSLDPALSPHRLVVTAVLADARDLAKGAVAEFHEQVLTLAPDGVARLRKQLSGPARAVVESLGRQRRTLGELESLDIVAKPTLAAIVYGLWLTGQIIPAGRRSKVPPSHPPADNQAAFKEQALEAKVTEAWVLAEADEARVVKASQFAAKAVTLFPQNPRLRFFAACLYQRANRIAEAKVEFAKAIELDPYYSDARRELARLQQGRS